MDLDFLSPHPNPLYSPTIHRQQLISSVLSSSFLFSFYYGRFFLMILNFVHLRVCAYFWCLGDFLVPKPQMFPRECRTGNINKSLMAGWGGEKKKRRNPKTNIGTKMAKGRNDWNEQYKKKWFLFTKKNESGCLKFFILWII